MSICHVFVFWAVLFGYMTKCHVKKRVNYNKDSKKSLLYGRIVFRMVIKFMAKQIKKCILALITYILSSSLLTGFAAGFIEVLNIKNVIISNIILLLSSIVAVAMTLYVSKIDIVSEFKKFMKDFENNIKTVFRIWGIGLLVMIFANVIINVVIMKGIAPNEVANRELLHTLPLYSIVSIAILAPLAEETLFRYNLKGIFKNQKIAILVSGLTFGFMHVISVDFSLQNMIFLVPYSILGFAFAKIYFDTDTVASSIIAHAIHNCLSLAVILLGV